MKLYDTYDAQREHFEILAFHDKTAPTLEVLDEKLEPIREKYWEGRSLPFPILLDETGETLKAFGISAFPTNVLIDPDGNVVPGNPEHVLEAKLKALAGEAPADAPQDAPAR